MTSSFTTESVEGRCVFQPRHTECACYYDAIPPFCCIMRSAYLPWLLRVAAVTEWQPYAPFYAPTLPSPPPLSRRHRSYPIRHGHIYPFCSFGSIQTPLCIESLHSEPSNPTYCHEPHRSHFVTAHLFGVRRYRLNLRSDRTTANRQVLLRVP